MYRITVQTFTYAATVPAGVRARIDLAVRNEDEAYWTVKNRSIVHDGDGGYSYRVEDAGAWDAAVLEGVLRIVDAAIAAWRRYQGPNTERQAAVHDLVEQRIAWTYRHHHSRTCTLEAFTDTVYAVLATHPAWESLQAAAKVSAAREAPPTGDFADHLEWWRRKARWSIEDLAGEAGLSKDAVQKHLSRTGMPYPRNLTKYEQALSTRFEREVILPIPPRPPRRRRRPAKNPRRIR